jgi:multiple sugar transport system permease protein
VTVRTAASAIPHRRSARRRSDLTFALLLAIPGLVWFLAFNAYPSIYSFWISFHDWKILGESEWVGFKNYLRVFQDPITLIALRNTAIYALVTVVGQMVCGLGLALLVNQKVPMASFFRVVYYFPVVASWVVVSLIFMFLFHSEGLINFLFSDLLNLYPAHRAWLNDPSFAIFAICALGVWKGAGWTMVIYLAALQGVPKELEEAAQVDGANFWQVTRYVTLPMLRAATMFITIMLTIGAFQSFIQFFIMTRGGPNHETEVFLSHMYNQAFTFLEFGYGSAIAFVLAAIILVISSLQLRYFRGENP